MFLLIVTYGINKKSSSLIINHCKILYNLFLGIWNFYAVVLENGKGFIENTLTTILPGVIRIFLIAGISDVVTGILIGIYQIFKKQEWKKLLLWRIISGTAICIGALLTEFLATYQVSYETYTSDSFKMQTLIAIFTFLILWNMLGQDKKSTN